MKSFLTILALAASAQAFAVAPCDSKVVEAGKTMSTKMEQLQPLLERERSKLNEAILKDQPADYTAANLLAKQVERITLEFCAVFKATYPAQESCEFRKDGTSKIMDGPFFYALCNNLEKDAKALP